MTMRAISMAMTARAVSVQIGTGLRSVARIAGVRIRKNPVNEYEMLVAAVVTIAPTSDSPTSATATIRQKAANGASAAITITGSSPPSTEEPAKMTITVPAIAAQRTKKADRLAMIFAAV